MSKDTVANREGDSPTQGSVDAITGATITSRAVCDAIRQGLNQVEQNPAGEYVPIEPEAAEVTGEPSEPEAADSTEPEVAEPTADGGENDGE